MKRCVYAMRRARRAGLLLGVGALLALPGCADDDDEAAGAGAIGPPATPTASQCAAGALPRSGAPPASVPGAGSYHYALRGQETTRAVVKEVEALPRGMRLLVTPALRRPHFACFRMQRRLRPSLVETATIVVHNEDLYLTELALETPEGRTLLAPQPPLLAAPADGLEWSGAFEGETRGRYTGRLLGRREISVGGELVRAVGVEVSSAYGGEVVGTQRSEQWFSTEDYLLLREENTERRRIGSDDLRLEYSARLTSTNPKGAR